MGSNSVTCHPTEVRIPPLSPAEAGTRFSDPGGMQGWVDLCYVKATGRELNPRPVNRKSDDLPLSHQAMFGWYGADVSVQRWEAHFLSKTNQNAGFWPIFFKHFPWVLPPDPHGGRGPHLPHPSPAHGLWLPIFSTLRRHCQEVFHRLI